MEKKTYFPPSNTNKTYTQGMAPQYQLPYPNQAFPPSPIYFMPYTSFSFDYPPYQNYYYHPSSAAPGQYQSRQPFQNKPRKQMIPGKQDQSFKAVGGNNSAANKAPESGKDEGKIAKRENAEARVGCNEAVISDNMQKAKFFIIKSYEKEHVKEAIKSGIWTSTQSGNTKLNNAWVEAKKEYPIYLLFSVNSSGFFQGVAEMTSEVKFDKYYEGWNQSGKWGGVIEIKWVFLKDVLNKSLKHILNPLNESKPIPNSRDTQEVPFEEGLQVLQIFEKAPNESKYLAELTK